MDRDMMDELGELALASRLRRLSDRLMRDASRIYRELEVDFHARWFPVLHLLGRRSPLSVGSIAKSLRITHPAVIQICAGMERKGLVSSSRDPGDDRRRLLALTPRGRELFARLAAVWEETADAARELMDATGQDVLSLLASLERELDREEMHVRVTRRLRERSLAAVEILDYAPAYRRRFRDLNLEWLRKEFTVEEPDRRMLSDPEGEILERGGAILFARLDGEIVGTCALLRRDARTYELAKMAVAEPARGRQIGRRLALAAIERARALGARRIVLQTSPKLVAALHLYRSLGFVMNPSDREGPARYRRPTISMKFDLGRTAGPHPRQRRNAS